MDLMDIVGPLGLGVLVGLVSSVGLMGLIGWMGLEQRPKNHPGIMALPSGKFLRVRKVIARNP